MKKMLNVIALVLALNFLLVAGAASWLARAGKVDRAKLMELKAVLFPPPAAPTTAPTTQPDSEMQPTLNLDALLAKAAGRSAGEQVDFIRQTFDAEMTMLDRRQRELLDLQRQVELAKAQLARDRTVLASGQQDLARSEKDAASLAGDKGFQDSLLMYSSMPSKQVKTLFLTLSDEVVQRYLQAMEPRQAAKIIKEYKTPEEVDRIQKVIEAIRRSGPTTRATASVP